MAFQHGKGCDVFVNGYDLSTYLNRIGASGMAEVANTTTFGASDKTYIPGLKDATISLEGLFEPTTGAENAVLNTALGVASGIVTFYPAGDAITNSGYGASGVEISYDIDIPVDDVVSVSADVQSSTGFERVISHAALAAYTSDTNGTAVDGTASSSNGGVGYIHATAFSGFTGVVVTVEDSADGSTGWATILSFTNITAANAKERVAITGTVRRYTRIVVDVTGTGSITLQVGFGRK